MASGEGGESFLFLVWDSLYTPRCVYDQPLFVDFWTLGSVVRMDVTSISMFLLFQGDENMNGAVNRSLFVYGIEIC